MGRFLVDEGTGEVVTELNPGDRIVRKKSVEYLSEVKVWKIDHFYKGNLSEINKWMRDLTPNEKAILFTVSPHVGYEDCCLKKENGDMLAFGDIVELSCLSRGAVSQGINSLIGKDILYRGKNSKGNRVNSVLKTMFRNYRVRVCQNIKWGKLEN
jgi:hypothetical protein